MSRRLFLAASSAALAAPVKPASIDAVLRGGMERRKIPAVVAMFASNNKTLYGGAFGARDASGVKVGLDSIFAIASMTKAVTTVAALQLVDEGRISLDEPVSKFLPKLANLDVLEGFDATGKPRLRPAKTAITLRHLITHTSGFCYDTWDEQMFRYTSLTPSPDMTKPGPLMFEPGKRWQYGQGVDWTGRLVEAISGLTLEEYFQQKIFQPLGMVDTSFLVKAAKFDRVVTRALHQADGEWKPMERMMPTPPQSFNGGGGLFSTAADYVRFMQMILNHGRGAGGVRLLKAKTVASMGVNQIGESTAGKMKSFRPAASADVDIQPGATEKWGLGFLINTTPYSGGRAAGSLAWAGLYNTFYWIDPKRNRCGVILMQFLPFVDKEAVGLFDEFERAVYGA